jgi:hypothetical protein
MLLVVAAGVASAAASESDSGAIVSHIPREQVQSSVLATVGYSKRRHILEIEFTSSAVYRYLDVPPSVHRDLMSAESKTRYYVTRIKRNYRSVRVHPRVKNDSPN